MSHLHTAETLAHSLLRPEVLGLTAYHVQDATGLVKLDAMENPYTWPEDMKAEWLAFIREAPVNRYPDPAANPLRTALRRANGISDDMALMLGNGSDELIQILLMAVAEPGAAVLAPEPTFVMYKQVAASLGLCFIGVDLQPDDFSLDMARMRESIATHKPKVIFLAYPNNPTGNAFAVEDMREILRIAPGLVVVDEAYAPFADGTFLPLLAEFPNLLVMRTLSKLGLAGLRLGYLVGLPAWVNELDKLRLPYNINVLTQLTAEFALAKPEVLDSQVAWLRRDRTLLTDRLAALPVRVFPSHANFVTFRLLQADASEVFQRLRQAGVLIKNLSAAGGLLSQCLRVTVGTPSENQRFIEALTDILEA